MNFIATSKYWLLAMVMLSLGAFAMGWHEKALRVPALIEDQKTSDLKACNIDKQITRKANYELQKDRDAIAQRAADYKRLHPMRCVIPANSSDVRAGGDGHAGQDGAGLSTDWLRDYAAECNLYRSEVISCINFLSEERKDRSLELP